MTRSARKPKQERSRETVRAIVEATRRVLAAVGPDDLTPAAVARVAGVGNGTLYTYFPTKASLLHAVEEEAWLAFVERVIGELAEVDGMPLADAAYRYSWIAVDMLAEHGRRHGFTPLDVHGLLERRELLVDRIVQALLDALSRTDTAHLRPRDVEFALRLVIRVAAAMAWRGITDFPDRLERGELQHEIATMITRYLVGASPPETPRSA